MLTTNSLIADSGYWIALFSRSDPFHQLATDALKKFGDYSLVVTWPIIVEVSYLLQKRAGFNQQKIFLAGIQEGGADIFHLNDDTHILQMTILMEKYRDLPMDLADASLLVLAEKLGHGRILSTDQRDFNAYRWKNREPFENLLLPES
jgi:predicted nucleic acid-binding protein